MIEGERLTELHGWVSRRAMEGDTKRLADALHAVLDLDVEQLLPDGGPFSTLGADEAITAAQEAIGKNLREGST